MLPTYSQDCGLEDQILSVSSSTHRARAPAEIRTVSIGAILTSVAFESTWQGNPDHVDNCIKAKKSDTLGFLHSSQSRKNH